MEDVLVSVDLKDLKMFFIFYKNELLIDGCFDFLYDAFIDVLNLYDWGTQNALYQFLTVSSYLTILNPSYVKVPQNKFEDLIDLPEPFYEIYPSYWKYIYEKYSIYIESIAEHNSHIKRMQKVLQ